MKQLLCNNVSFLMFRLKVSLKLNISVFLKSSGIYSTITQRCPKTHSQMKVCDSLCLRMMKMNLTLWELCWELSALCVADTGQHRCGCWAYVRHTECYRVKTGTRTSHWHDTFSPVTVFSYGNRLHMCLYEYLWVCHRFVCYRCTE